MRGREIQVLAGLALTQVIGWGTTFYLPALLGREMVRALGIPFALAFGGISIMMLVGAALSPPMGRLIERHGARRFLMAGSALMAAALLLLGMAQGLWSYVAAWVCMGLAVPLALNLAAYVALAQVFTRSATQAMTVLGFFTGLSSTLSWPLTGALSGVLGWRGVCMAYACVHLCVALPLHAWILRPLPARDGGRPAAGAAAPGHAPASPRPFFMLAFALALNCFLMTGLQAHLIGLLEGLGVATAAAVGLGSLMGPSQVGARAASFGFARSMPAIRLALWATGLFCGALALFAAGHGWMATLAAAIVLLGTAMGLSLPIRATLPYEMYGSAQFGRYMGKLGLVQNLASAAAPVTLASALGRLGPVPTLLLATGVAAASFMGMALVARRLRQ